MRVCLPAWLHARTNAKKTARKEEKEEERRGWSFKDRRRQVHFRLTHSNHFTVSPLYFTQARACIPSCLLIERGEESEEWG